MDKYEYKVKLAQIEKLTAKKDFVTAAKIADGIDWRKVKSVTTLNMIADIYEENQRLEDCYEILNMVYDRSPVSRRIVYRMAEVATKLHDFEEAIDLYKEFVRIAPHDLSRYLLKYQIYRERGSSVRDQITILEEYKSHEYDEKWSYELACLYEEAGMIDQCVEECDELILWFSEGEYVAKAMELKMKYRELSASQKEKYEHRYDYLEEEAYFSETEEEAEETEAAEVPLKEEVQDDAQKMENIPENTEDEEETPKVSVINVNKFSTINLQEELAKGLQQILAQAEEEAKEEQEAEEAEVERAASKEQEAEEAKEETAETEPVTEAETKVEEEVEPVVEIEVEPENETEVEAEVETLKSVLQKTEPEKEAIKESEALEQQATKEFVIVHKNKTEETAALSETAELRSEILKYVKTPQEKTMEEMFCVEEDGQISLAIGDEDVLEKQITGQMTIEEVLEAWEEKKRQAKLQKEAQGSRREAVLFETGEITELLKDFIPTTPRMKEEIPAEPVKEAEPAEDAFTEAEPVIYQEEEAVACQETEKEPVEEAETPEIEIPESIEDDLPVDIDFSEALEEALKTADKEVEKVSQNTASMLDAIEKALAQDMTPIETAGYYLTDDQVKIFAYFTSVAGMKKQLTELLTEYAGSGEREDSREGNLIITGHPGNGKTTLAIDIVKAFQRQKNTKGGKLAKVTGDGLNKKDPEEVVKKLGGGALIIERAGSLKEETIQKLSTAMEGNTGGLLVILEDDSAEIEKILHKQESFAKKFTRSVNIPIFSNDELVAFGKSYAEEQEYYLDEMAVLALYDSIGVRQTSDHVVNIAEVKEFVDDAIAHAEKKSRGFFARLSRKRIDEDGNKLLLEEDFD